MDVNQLIKATMVGLRSDEEVHPPDDILGYLNEAYVDLAARLQILHRTETGTTTSDTIALPDGITGTLGAIDPAAIKVLNLRLGTKDDAELVDDANWYSWKDAGATPPHTIYRVVASTSVQLYPVPVTGTAYALEYAWIPSGDAPGTRLLDEGTDVPKLPPQLHRKLVFYAQAQAKKLEGELQDYRDLLSLYEDGLPPPALGITLEHSGPLTVSLEPGPFDLDPDRQHN